MSKASIETGLTETLIYPCSTHKDAVEVRRTLVEQFKGCWFFLYAHSFEIYATNEMGGRLTEDKAKDIKAAALKANTALYIK